jgi:transcriptional regulator with XRE-family HTH domain
MRQNQTKVTIGESFGNRIRKLREDKGMTQLDLCKTTGWGQAYLSRLENGGIDVGLETIKILAHTFDLSVSELLKGVDGVLRTRKLT